ncbi:hypothetical protein GCM10022223_56780 [Kineosporia mesophila]|uniref:Uncharacterized protein n=1 Tax=Kineosporia mesophila TaxID=566012 RepID=A0ABP7AFH6_9ACTN
MGSNGPLVPETVGSRADAPEGVASVSSARFLGCAAVDPDIMKTTVTPSRKAVTAAARRSAVAPPRTNRAESVHRTP